MTSLFDLQGKVALVTGGTSGIGLAVARQMAVHGATVIISGLSFSDCEQAIAQMARDGEMVSGLEADLRFKAEADRLAADAISLHGHVDVLVCCAGVAPHMGPLSSASDEQWDITMDVNLRSAVWLTNALLPSMAARRDGSVILMSSIAGVRGNKALGVYGLSKAALSQLARNLAVEWGPSNVRVNAIAPGVVRTAFARPLTDHKDVLERRLLLTPLRRVGEVDEVAGVAVMLASRAGAFITGQNIVVDGGTTISDGN